MKLSDPCVGVNDAGLKGKGARLNGKGACAYLLDVLRFHGGLSFHLLKLILEMGDHLSPLRRLEVMSAEGLTTSNRVLLIYMLYFIYNAIYFYILNS